MTTPITPSQNPKTLDEVCDKPTGTFKEYVKAQDNLTALQKAVDSAERLKAKLPLAWYGQLGLYFGEELLSAAKQLSALQTENEGLMLRSVAAMHIAEEEDYSSIPIDCPMLGEVLKLRQNRDSLKSTLEATLKTFDERGAALVALQGMLKSMTKERDEFREHLANVNRENQDNKVAFENEYRMHMDTKQWLESTRKENVKMREALNKVFDEVEPTGKHFCLDCFNVIQKALTPLTNEDNSKEDAK